MESEYRQVQEECQDLQALLEQRDDQLCTLNQDLLDLTLRMKVSLTAPPLSCVAAAASAATCHVIIAAFAAVFAAWGKPILLKGGICM